jgi:hypothetical protein
MYESTLDSRHPMLGPDLEANSLLLDLLLEPKLAEIQELALDPANAGLTGTICTIRRD